eukprot:124204-Chlamydomonas_euryale.AAC.1
MFSAPLKCLVGNDFPNFGIPIFRLSTVFASLACVHHSNAEQLWPLPWLLRPSEGIRVSCFNKTYCKWTSCVGIRLVPGKGKLTCACTVEGVPHEPGFKGAATSACNAKP